MGRMFFLGIRIKLGGRRGGRRMRMWMEYRGKRGADAMRR